LIGVCFNKGGFRLMGEGDMAKREGSGCG